MRHMRVDEVLRIISGALQLQNEEITLDSSMSNVAAWDSLGHLSLLVAIDKAFDKKVAGIKEMATADSVQKILALLKEHGLVS